MLLDSAPPELTALWTAALALATTLLTQGLKTLVTPVHNAPDWVKSAIALGIAIAGTLFTRVFGIAVPPTLNGVAIVLVAWLGAMGLHKLALVLKVLPTTPTP